MSMHCKPSVGRKGAGWDRRERKRHEQIVERCDGEYSYEYTKLDAALDRLDRAGRRSPLPFTCLVKSAARRVAQTPKEELLKHFKHNEERAIHHVDCTRERLERQGNTPLRDLVTPLLRGLKADLSKVKSHSLKGLATKIASMDRFEAVAYFLSEEKAISSIRNIRASLK